MNTPAACQAEARGVAEPLATLITEAARLALRSLGDEAPARRVIICVDDLPGTEELPWYGDRDPDFPGRPTLVLYCGLDAFLEPAPRRTTLSGAPAIWEPFYPSCGGETGLDERFSPGATERFLHHHLLFAADLLACRVETALVPRSEQPAFQAAWAVTVDGRLARGGLPGYSLQERRGLFSRLFAGSGILLPDHWRIFRALWDGGIVAQAEVLAAVRRLPRL